jgi:hypothetical protein
MSSNKYLITMSLMNKLHKRNVPMFIKRVEKSLVRFKPPVVIHDVEFVVKRDVCASAGVNACSVKECGVKKNVKFYQRVFGSQVPHTHILMLNNCEKKNK